MNSAPLRTEMRSPGRPTTRLTNACPSYFGERKTTSSPRAGVPKRMSGFLKNGGTSPKAPLVATMRSPMSRVGAIEPDVIEKTSRYDERSERKVACEMPKKTSQASNTGPHLG